MAVRRSQNWLNQQRVDVPHLRSVESGVRNDFDELLESLITGEDASFILRGWELNMVGAIGASSSSLQMIVENSSLLHGKSAVSGTFFKVAVGVPNQTINSTTNPAVQGSFTPSALNYVGIEFVRAVDNSTTAQVFLWNPTNKNEISKTVPLAETLNYNIVVTSSIWASNVLPISIVETDSSNNVLSVEDRRPMLFRLGSGGPNTPNPFYEYPWDHHAEGREENFWKSSSAVSPFRGGDKQIQSEKEWKDAVMSMIKEVKGTTYWYSENAGGSIIKLRGDLALLQMTGTGKFTHALTTAGQINWTSDIFLNYIGSRLSYKILSYPTGGNVTIGNGQVAYINLVRGVDVIPNLIFTQSSATVNSVGAVSWTSNVLAGDYIKIAIADDTKYYKILSVDTASQVTLESVYLETSTGSGGAEAQYAYGTYQTAAVPSTNRHMFIVDRKDVPFDDDVYWIFMREDNGGSTARAYIRGSSGGELQQGEDREISDNTSIEVLEYIGSSSEVDNTPDYTNALVTSLPEERTLTFPPASSLVSGQYFTLNSALDIKKYYVWANINGAGGNPTPPGLESIEVALLSSDTNLQVAAKYQVVLNASAYFDSINNLNGTISLDNIQVGASSNAVDVNMGGIFSINTTQEGTGSYNNHVVDDENLTKSIKRLDEAIGAVEAAIDSDPYEESIDVVDGTPAVIAQVTDIFGSTSQLWTAARRNSQPFIPTSSSSMFSALFYLSVSAGTPNFNLVADVYTDVAGNPGVLLGTSTNSIPATSLTGIISPYTWTFAGPYVIASTTYHLVLRPANFVASGNLDFHISATYAGGNGLTSTNSGASWGTVSRPFRFTIQGATTAGVNQIAGPVSAGTPITIPLNTRNADVQETYVVDRVDLIVILNGNVQVLGRDYTEVGSSGDDSTQIEFLFQLDPDDVIDFRKFHADASGSGGAVSGVNLGSASDADVFKQTIGSQLQFRRLTAGSNVTITENANDIIIAATSSVAPVSTRLVNGVNTAILTTDATVHGINSGVNITFTLPDANIVEGQFYYFKKRDAGNTLFIKSVMGQLLDSVDIDAAPKPITIQNEALTIQAMGGSWWIQ